MKAMGVSPRHSNRKSESISEFLALTQMLKKMGVQTSILTRNLRRLKKRTPASQMLLDSNRRSLRRQVSSKEESTGVVLLGTIRA